MINLNYLFFIFISVGLFIITLLVLKKLYYFIKNSPQKITTPAKIIQKKIDQNNGRNTYILIFELYTGKKLIFKVSAYYYSLFYIGDKGILTYKGSKFIYFKKRF